MIHDLRMRVGLRADDAAAAADFFAAKLREMRNESIRAAVEAGVNKSQVARIYSVDRAVVIRVCRQPPGRVGAGVTRPPT